MFRLMRPNLNNVTNAAVTAAAAAIKSPKTECDDSKRALHIYFGGLENKLCDGQ